MNIEMTRRSFLKALGAGAVTLAVPISLGNNREVSANIPIVGRLSGTGIRGDQILQGNEEAIMSYSVEITAQEDNYGHDIGVVYSLIGEDGSRYRQGITSPYWDENKKSSKGLMNMSKDVSEQLGEWIKSHPQLSHYRPPTKDMVFNAIAGKFS